MGSQRTSRRGLALAGVLAAAALVVPQAALAGPGATNGAVVAKGSKQVERIAPTVEGEGVGTQTTVVSDAARVSVASLGADAELLSADGLSLAQAAAATTVWFRTWTQKIESLLWGIAWKEEHRGGYYWDGTRVWLTKRLGSDTSGYHRCGYNSGIGFTVSVTSCWKTGDPSLTQMVNGDQFKVSALFKGFPISATHEMKVCMTPKGGFKGC